MRIAFSSTQVNVPARLPPGQADTGHTSPSADGELEASASFRVPPQEVVPKPDGQAAVRKPPQGGQVRGTSDPRSSGPGGLQPRSLGGAPPPRALPPGVNAPSPLSAEVVSETQPGAPQPVYVVLQWNVQLPGQVISGQTPPTWVQGDLDVRAQGSPDAQPAPRGARDAPPAQNFPLQPQPAPLPTRVPTNVPVAEFVGQAFVAVDDRRQEGIHESDRERPREASASTSRVRASYRRSCPDDVAAAADGCAPRKERIVTQG